MLDVDGFQTCFVSAASAFQIIELANIHCALKENFSVALTENYVNYGELRCDSVMTAHEF